MRPIFPFCCLKLFRGIAPLAIFFLAGVAVAAESTALLNIPASETTLHVAVPSPGGVELQSADAWQLVEVDEPNVAVRVEVVPAVAADGTADKGQDSLLAVVPPRRGAESPRRFRLEPAQQTAEIGFQFEDVDAKSLKLAEGAQSVLVYNHGPITREDVPQSDHRRTRACYIHPLWGLSGEVLTDDFPKDHYHHHGVFWTWPHVQVEGDDRPYDIWAGPNIRDRFVRWMYREAGPVAAVLAVENGWFVGERKVMIERVWLRTYRALDDQRVLDLEFAWIPVDRPITLWGAEGKSYGGLTVRFAPRSREETLITVPSGRTTGDLPDTPLQWADLTSKFGQRETPSGAAVFIPPSHPDYPPTWLTRYYGPLCVGWPGVKPKTFEAGKPIRLSYRIWIHKSAVELDDLQRAYEAYVAASSTDGAAPGDVGKSR
ncbi:MAG: PmoA family protein [Pirellulales bacterium]|nr:PmoA family protein [Pirellulales bacterium]